MITQLRNLVKEIGIVLLIVSPLLIVLPMLPIGFVLGMIWLGLENGFMVAIEFPRWAQKFKVLAPKEKL